MAAWGAIQKIIAAIDRFIAFLKAVKSGGAGPAFANALAAAAVAVIEFVSQFLLRKIAGAAGKVAGKIKAIAQKIGKRLMKVVKKVGKGLKKVGKKIKRGATRLKDKVFGKKKKSKKDKKDDKQDKQDRLDKAVRELTPKVRALVDKGVGKLRMKAQLAFWKLRYRLSSLEITGAGKAVGIRAKVNPEADLIRNVIVTSGSLLHEQVDRVWPIVQQNPKVQDAVRKMRDQRAAKFEDKTDEQTKDGRNIKGPYNRGEVDETGVPGASQIDVGTGSKIGDNGIDRPNRSMEQHNFLVDQHGKPLVSTSEKQENTGPGGIMVTAAALTTSGSRSCRALVAGVHVDGGGHPRAAVRPPAPAGRRPQEGRRVRSPQPGRGRPRQGLLRRAADDGPAHGPGEGDRRRRPPPAPDEPDRRDGHRAQLGQDPRAPGERPPGHRRRPHPGQEGREAALAGPAQVEAGRPAHVRAVAQGHGSLLGP